MKSVNLNDTIKVKLTPLGADIFYHQYDELNKKHRREVIKPHMPIIDNDGFSKFQMWEFIQLYGNHIGMAFQNVIEPINIYF